MPLAILGAMIAVSAATAMTASNSVPATRVGVSSVAITANSLKPAECSALGTLTAIKIGSGSFSGTSAAELVLGSAGADTINAAGGNDCVLGGGGNDSLQGGGGTDVCDGGPGTDTFNSDCETKIA